MALQERHPQLLAVRALHDLRDQMGPATCREFVANYIAMWDGRFQRLALAAADGDLPAAMDVVLSIKISSHMAGAERLATLAAAAQEVVKNYDLSGLTVLLEGISACGAETMLELAASLDTLR